MARKSKGKKRIKNVRWARRIVFLVVLAAVLAVGFLFESKINSVLGFAPEKSEPTVISDGSLRVHFLDVGQGDACIVELPDDRNMLIDAGDNNKTVKNKLKTYITDNISDDDGTTIDYFDFCIMTHSDADHVGSMAYILNLFPAKTVYRPNQECKFNGYADPAHNGNAARNRFWGNELKSQDTKTYREALEAAYQSNAEFTPEVIVTNPMDDTQNTITSLDQTEEFSIDFYSPLSPTYSDDNNYSPIIILSYGDKKITLSGDAEAQNEREFVKKANEGKDRYAIFTDYFFVDVIKLGHHGSRTSSSEEYLEVMTTAESRPAALVIISSGKNNKYGHPHEEVLTRLANMGFSDDNILRTDKLGDIRVEIQCRNGIYSLLHGDEVVITAVKKIPTFGYRQIAFAVFVAAFVILILVPLGVNLKRKK